MTDLVKHQRMANAIRALAMDAVERANSGHPGMPMGMADVATVLFTRYLKFDPTEPRWPDRDRFVLSAGHGSMLLYSVLFLLGVEEMTMDEIRNFRQLGSKTPGHPENFVTPGVETTTGPLGQGLGNAVGMALAERLMAAQFGDDIVDHRTYVIASDGDLMEGISHEAISIAGHLRLSKLIVFFDDNSISIDGPLSLSESGDQVARFEAAGWNASRIDGSNPDEIAAAIEAAQKSDRPTMIACRTTIGFGAPTKAGKASSHGSPLGAEEIAGARKALGWDYPPFEVPADVRDAWRIAGLKASQVRKEWEKRLAAVDAEKRAEFERRIRGELPPGFDGVIADYKRKLAADRPKVATRKSSEMALDVINPAVPETIGGSADLTGSNNTKSKDMKDVTPTDFSGRYIRWGVREHGDGLGDERHGAPWRAHPLWRHLPRLQRLLPPGDPPRGADGQPGHLRHDPRFDRPRRGRPDPPAGRAARGAPRHPQPPRLPPGRRDGDGRVLAAHARARPEPERHRAHPPEPAGGADRIHRGQSLRPRRL